MKINSINNTKGFSLLEILITLALFILIGGISVPAFANWLEYNKLKKSVLIFEDTLNIAKERSREMQKIIQVNLENSGNMEKITIIDGSSESSNCSGLTKEAVYISELIEAQIKEITVIAKVCFFSNGTSSGADFKVQKNDKFFQIKINKHTGFIEKLS